MLTQLDVFRLRSELALEDLKEVQRQAETLRRQLTDLEAQRDRVWVAYDLALAEEQRLFLQWLKAYRQYTYYPPVRQDEPPFVLLLPMCIR
jgi:hypothetical protein